MITKDSSGPVSQSAVRAFYYIFITSGDGGRAVKNKNKIVLLCYTDVLYCTDVLISCRGSLSSDYHLSLR